MFQFDHLSIFLVYCSLWNSIFDIRFCDHGDGVKLIIETFLLI